MSLMPAPGTMVQLSPAYTPAHLMGMTIHPDNALKFDFLIHKGDGDLTDIQKKQEYTKLVKYFLASLTIPDKDQWVNLSPYEHNRIIADNFGKTEMGRDLLEEDYFLKQITSSLMYPESGLGKSFWDKVYARAWTEYHTTNIPVNTFNKVWIIPDQAIVYESKNTAYIIKSHLKVMLEEDYLAMSKNRSQPGDIFQRRCPHQVNHLSSQIIKEIILPELEKEVNEGKNFAQLRQIVSSMILAAWYKKALKESLLGKIYADKAKVKGVDYLSKGPIALDSKGFVIASPEQSLNIDSIYHQYLQAFKKGVYNYIKEDEDKYTHQSIPRKYFAGGFEHPVVNSFSPAMMTPDLTQSAIETWQDAMGDVDKAEVVLDSGRPDAVMGSFRKAVGHRTKRILLSGIKIIFDKQRGARMRRLVKATIEDINAQKQSDPENIRQFVMHTAFAHYEDQVRMEDAPAFAQMLNEAWGAAGFDETFGPLFDWIVLNKGGRYGSPDDLKHRYQWIYRFLEGGSPSERAFGLWLLAVGNVAHLRKVGLHPEADKRIGGKMHFDFVDNNLILGDGLNPGLLQEYLSAILKLKTTGEFTKILPGPDGNPNALGLTQKDLLLWGLVLVADPSIHAPFGRGSNPSDYVLRTLRQEWGEDVTFDSVMVKSIEKAFSHIPQEQLEQIQPLLVEALSMTDKQWEAKGFKSPYHYGVSDEIREAVSSHHFENDTFWQTYPLLDKFKMFPFLRGYLPSYEVRDILEIGKNSISSLNVSLRQNSDGLGRFYTQVYPSPYLAAILPDVAAVFAKEREDAAMLGNTMAKRISQFMSDENVTPQQKEDLLKDLLNLKMDPEQNSFSNKIGLERNSELRRRFIEEVAKMLQESSGGTLGFLRLIQANSEGIRIFIKREMEPRVKQGYLQAYLDYLHALAQEIHSGVIQQHSVKADIEEILQGLHISQKFELMSDLFNLTRSPLKRGQSWVRYNFRQPYDVSRWKWRSLMDIGESLEGSSHGGLTYTDQYIGNNSRYVQIGVVQRFRDDSIKQGYWQAYLDNLDALLTDIVIENGMRQEVVWNAAETFQETRQGKEVVKEWLRRLITVSEIDVPQANSLIDEFSVYTGNDDWDFYLDVYLAKTLKLLFNIDSRDFLSEGFYIQEPVAQYGRIKIGFRPTSKRSMLDKDTSLRLKASVKKYITEIIEEIDRLPDNAMTTLGVSRRGVLIGSGSLLLAGASDPETENYMGSIDGEKVMPGSPKWKEIQDFIQSAIDDPFFAEEDNSKYLDAIKAFQRASLQELFDLKDDYLYGSSVAVSENERFTRFQAGINLEYINKLLIKSKSNPLYKRLAYSVLIKEGATILDYENRQNYYAKLSTIESEVKRSGDENLKRYIAMVVEKEAVGYRLKMGYFIKANQGNVGQQLHDLLQNEKDPQIQRTLHAAYRFLISMNRDEKEGNGLYVRATTYAYTVSKLLFEDNKKRFEDMIDRQSDIPNAMNRFNHYEYFDDPNLLKQIRFLDDTAYYSGDTAQLIQLNKDIKGGIDLNSVNLNLQIKRDGKGVPLPLIQQDMAQLSRIQGFEPEIIEIRPAVNLPILSELQQLR